MNIIAIVRFSQQDGLLRAILLPFAMADFAADRGSSKHPYGARCISRFSNWRVRRDYPSVLTRPCQKCQ